MANSDQPSPESRGGRASRLEECYDHIDDAYTVESAIFWHCEILSELSAAVAEVKKANRSDARTRSLLAKLETEHDEHTLAVHRLTGVVQRHERVAWNP